jgi:serine/threonine protein kinase
LLPHLASDEQIFKRFLNEVLVARSLSHPNIVRLHDIGKAEAGYYYISMELVDGYSLKERICSDDPALPSSSTQLGFKPLTFTEALQILADIASGVAYAHTRGVMHRDLKPGNVLISKRGEVKLADFGTARIMGMDTSLTQTGQVIGTPDYMSPEQIRGEALDSACDIYSLGIIGYELVTGTRPYEADSAVAVAFKHLSEPLPPFGEKLKHIPAWYRTLVEKATAKDRKLRYQNGKEFLADLQKNIPGGTESFAGGSFAGVIETGRFELGESGGNSQSSGTDWKLGDGGSIPQLAATKKKNGSNALLLVLFIGTLALGTAFFTFRDQLLPVDQLPSQRNPELGASEIQKQLERLEDRPKTTSSIKSVEVNGLESHSSEVLRPEVNSAASIAPTAEVSAIQKDASSLPPNVVISTEVSSVTAVAAPELTATPTASPTAKPTPEPTATPTAKPKEVSASLQLKFAGARSDEFASDALSKVTWEIGLEGLSHSQAEELVINLVNSSQGSLVTKLRPSNVATKGDKLVLSGKFEGIARTLQADSYRLDVVKSGEMLASSRFAVTRSETSPTVAPTTLPVETPEALPTSTTEQPLGEVSPPEAVTRNYSGTIDLNTGDNTSAKGITLNLLFQGLNISGTAKIEGVGELVVTGQEMVRGYEMSLRNGEIQMRLTSGKGSGGMKGSYVIAGRSVRGAWQARLNN